MSGPLLRPYRPEDLADVRRVCLLTGDAGGDATGLYSDDGLIADVWAEPYVRYAPELATVVDLDGRAAGYILGVADSRDFASWWRREWLPSFAARHPLVDPPVTAEDGVVAWGHHPERQALRDLDLFPAHLHIDLLPEVQGRGLGRNLVRTLLLGLRDRGVPGVQLGVGATNTGARAFYARLGFRPLPSTPHDELVLGLPTGAEV